MNRIIARIDNQLDECGFTSDCVVTLDDVRSAVSKLKHGKGDVNNLIASNHFIYATDDLFIHISLLLSSLIILGSAPDMFLRSTITPIPKGHNQNLSDSANYRGIAISSILGKLLDNIILNKYRHLLCTSELQFGFKQEHSTHMCTMVLKETISYYMHNSSSVFCTFLDATKAFDRVHYCKLFNELLRRCLPPAIIRILIKFYANFVQVSWLGRNSDTFIASNGVKQGGVLSPILFCVYIDNLLTQLSRAGVGCHDIVLVAPTPSAMRTLLTVCDGFAADNDISFNASKSKCVLINPKPQHHRCPIRFNRRNLHFTISDHEIEIVDSYKHLGHIINSQFDDCDDIADKRSVFIGQANNVICYFGNLSSYVKQRLFNSYCTSFFGCELWPLDHREIESLCTAWRRAIRRVWSLPYTAHNFLLPILSNSLPLHVEYQRRVGNFINKCLYHKSDLIRGITAHGVRFARARSPIGYNYLLSNRPIIVTSSSRVDSSDSVDELTRANFIRELSCLRDGVFCFSSLTPLLSSSEISEIICLLATI
jgi:hypothetical protein